MNVFQRKSDFRGNILMQLSFCWLDKLFFKGFRGLLTLSDLYSCPTEQRSRELYQKFELHWQKELEKRNPDIKIAIAKSLKTLMLIAFTVLTCEGIFVLIQTILIAHFSTSCLQSPSNQTGSELGSSLAYTFAISLITLSLPLVHCTGFYLMYCAAMRTRTICITAIYKKIVRIQQAVLYRVSTGLIINLVSNDVYRFELGIRYFNFFFVSPVIAVFSMIIIVVYIGPIGLIGLVYIMLHTPLQIGLGFLFGHFRYLQSVTGDERIRMMDQIIRGMRVIKFYVWENPFVKYISKIRRKEVLYASLAGVTQSSTYSFFNSSLYIGIFLIYSVSLALNQPLVTSQLALSFLLLNLVNLYCVGLLGNAIFSFRESVIALKRIQRVLELPESIPNSSVHSTKHSSVELTDFSASWKGTEREDENDLVLKSVSFTLDQPQLVAVAGPIGAGKSSLLMSLINELPGQAGQLKITGVTSYSSQVPWIFSGSLRDNILFGNQLDSARYWGVVNACSLKEDIDALENGDLTLIGERGVTLSGGQKARVSLARSVYHRADIYLLDDPLSAVDTRVGKEIFDNCIRGLLKDKIVVLVTHQIHFVRKADFILVMNEGTVVCKGSYQDVVERDDFSKTFLRGLEKSDDENKVEENTFVSEENIYVAVSEEKATPTETDKQTEADPQPLSKALTAEDYTPSTIGVLTYFRYFWAGGFLATLLLIIFTVASNGGLLLAYWWMQSIATCSENQLMRGMNQTNGTNVSLACPWYFDYRHGGSLSLLAAFVSAGSVFVFLRGFNFYYVLLQASRRFHNRMLRRLVHAPMHFFDTNPSGRILNRFSKDIGFMDEQLPKEFYEFWQHSTYNLSIVIAICAVQNFMVIPFVLLAVLTLLLRFYYLRSSTQIKRLESIARSPLYSHLSLTLQGLSTIRALGIEARVTQDFHFFQDAHSCAWYFYVVGERWFGLRLDFLSALTIVFGIFAAFFARCVFARDELIGFALPLLFSIALIFQFMVRLSGQVEIYMVSVDRVLKYIGLPQERRVPSSSSPPSSPSFSPSSPDSGRIEYKNLLFRYSEDLPFALKNVSLSISPGEKIGIIGRTGAGKSSLFNSLLRINELSGGSITVDHKDIQSLDLYDHRNRMSVIPQDPFLFSGTLRYNLDPFSEFSSAEAWAALDKSHLKGMVECLPGQLGARVEEDGNNFSTGERQLLCLARAMLRKNKIILIDEATANVDLHTDQLVQQAIRSHFSHCSVLTIAHRIETVLDSDRIVVLENGCIVEVDTPSSMLRDEGSYLSRLLTHLDPVTRANLRDIAGSRSSSV